MHSGIKEIEYGKKGVPNVKLTLYLEGRAVYSLMSTTLKEYDEEIRTDPKTYKCLPEIHMVDSLMNPDDYEILITRKYDKYVLDVEDVWRSIEGNDEGFSRHFEFNSMRIFHDVNYEGIPAEWNIILENEV